jgi:hypothetical protein
VGIRIRSVTLALGAAAAAMAIANAPAAAAAPSEPLCSDAGGATDCSGQGNHEVYTSPRPLPRVFPPTINPRYRGSGYSPRYPEYGFKPGWQNFGYNPKYSGFQPRPSVLRPFELPETQDVRCPTPSRSACTPPDVKPTDTGGSTIYQTAGHVQVTAQVGLPALHANQSQYPSATRPAADDGGLTVHQRAGHVQITAKPGPAAQNASQQAVYFPVPNLPRV